MIALRDYQQRAVASVETGWQQWQRQLGVAATGSGKTIIFSHLAAAEPGRTLILAHREELVTQAVQKLRAATGIFASVEQGSKRAMPGHGVIVGSVQSVRRRLAKYAPDAFDLVICDEAHHCFPYYTKILTSEGLLSIGEIVTQQMKVLVATADLFNNTLTFKPVVSWFRNPVKKTLTITHEQGRFTCTHDHKIWTEWGYVRAENLIHGMRLRILPDAIPAIQSVLQAPPFLQQVVSREMDDGPSASTRAALEQEHESANREKMRLVQSRILAPVPGSRDERKLQILLAKVRANRDRETSIGHSVEAPQCSQNARQSYGHEAPRYIGPNEGEESNADSSNEAKNGEKSFGSHLPGARGQWTADDSATGASQSNRMADGVLNIDPAGSRNVSVLADLLQGGPCDSRAEDCNRGGRPFAQQQEVEVSGSQENKGAVFSRVVSVEVSKCDGESGLGESDSDCEFLYDIEVEGTHNYFADGVLVSNCLSDEWQCVLSHFSAARVLGVTATPDRSDRRSLGKYFQNVAFEIGLLELIGSGHLCGLRALRLPVELDTRNLKLKRGDIGADDAAALIHPQLAELACAVAGEIWDRKALIFLPRCDVSEAFSNALYTNGIDALHVAGSFAPAGREHALGRFQRGGAGTALCNAMLLTEGYDQPDIDCVVVLRPTHSRSLYAQMVGRGTRLAPDKEFCIAEGTEILTDCGLIPIEEVDKSMRVWDGTCFVRHGGVIFKGEQETITYEGLTATPEHRVWTQRGWAEFGEVARLSAPIAITGDGGRAIQESDCRFTGDSAYRQVKDDSDVNALRDVRGCEMASSLNAIDGGSGLPEVRPSSSGNSGPRMAALSRDATAPALLKSQGRSIQGLRWPRNSVQVSGSLRGVCLGNSESRDQEGIATGSNRERGSLRARKLAMGNRETESTAHAEASINREVFRVQEKSSKRKVCGQNAPQNDTPQNDASGNLCPVGIAFQKTKRRVWDILNCGPLNRFTANGLLVHNCLLIDPLWICGEIDLCKPCDLTGGDKLHRDKLQTRLDEGNDLLTAESIARSDVEEALAERLREAQKLKRAPRGLVDPLAWAIGIHDSDLETYEPAMPWECEEPTAEQVEILTGYGLWTENVTRGYARVLIERCNQRAMRGLASPKQVRLLRQFGEPNADVMTTAQASAEIGRRLGRAA